MCHFTTAGYGYHYLDYSSSVPGQLICHQTYPCYPYYRLPFMVMSSHVMLAQSSTPRSGSGAIGSAPVLAVNASVEASADCRATLLLGSWLVDMADPGQGRDPPSWDGTGGKPELDRYLQYAHGYVLGLSNQDRSTATVRLWRSLRGLAMTRTRDTVDFDVLAADAGADELTNGWDAYKALLAAAFPESSLRQLPRLYRQFFAEVSWKGEMETLIRDLERAGKELTAGDPESKVGDGMLGYWCLVKSRLADKEVMHVIGLSGNALRLSAMRIHLIELCILVAPTRRTARARTWSMRTRIPSRGTDRKSVV